MLKPLVQALTASSSVLQGNVAGSNLFCFLFLSCTSSVSLSFLVWHAWQLNKLLRICLVAHTHDLYLFPPPEGDQIQCIVTRKKIQGHALLSEARWFCQKNRTKPRETKTGRRTQRCHVLERYWSSCIGRQLSFRILMWSPDHPYLWDPGKTGIERRIIPRIFRHQTEKALNRAKLMDPRRGVRHLKQLYFAGPLAAMAHIHAEFITNSYYSCSVYRQWL